MSEAEDDDKGRQKPKLTLLVVKFGLLVILAVVVVGSIKLNEAHLG